MRALRSLSCPVADRAGKGAVCPLVALFHIVLHIATSLHHAACTGAPVWLPARLRSVLESLETAQNLQGEVQALQGKIEALEALQLDREVQWTEAKDQIFRHMKRVQAIRQHASEPDTGAELRNQLIARKFPKGG